MTTGGPVAAADLGRVLPHEHVFINEMIEDRAGGLLNDAGLARSELDAFVRAGGGTLVELTSAGLTAGASPDPRGLYGGPVASGFPDHNTRSAGNVASIAALAAETGIRMVLGTGHYRDPYLTEDLDRRSIEESAADIVRDLVEGFPGTDVRAGIIGEVGADKWYVSPREERSIRAAGRAHIATGVTVTTHASKWPVGGDVIDLLLDEGVAPERIITGHCSTIDIPEYHLDIARRGTWLQFDTIRGGAAVVVDRWVQQIMTLVRAGYLDRVLLSHDVCLKSHLAVNGGCGYAYLFEEFLPKLGRAGLDDGELEQLVTTNPQRAICS
jgi:predicted metal-dependent phosphotriesterase family hydrolase